MNTSERDKIAVWHPYANSELYGTAIPITSASGAYLFAEDGKKYIDAISSWWTAIHGHSHPHLVEKISQQLKTLDHVIFSGFTHEPAVRLAERLLSRLPFSQKKIFYSDNGSTAVEVALKMAFQYYSNRGEKRTKVIAFKNSYHGDTFGAMAVSGRGTFTRPFADLLFDVIYVDAPIKGNEESALEELKIQVAKHKSELASFIFEPLVQGTAGMQMHESAALSEMISICRENSILTVADEVMTGFGRTGKFFASDFLSATADIFCLSKGLTGGTMAMGVTSCSQQIFDAFQGTDQYKTFFHGHSYTANPIACSAALASLDLFEGETVFNDINRISALHTAFVAKISGHKSVKEIRCKGTILALELQTKEVASYFSDVRKIIYTYFLEKGILLRPLGNIIYLMPPYCISNEDLNYIYEMIEQFLKTID